jgi:hypothetical protein
VEGLERLADLPAWAQALASGGVGSRRPGGAQPAGMNPAARPQVWRVTAPGRLRLLPRERAARPAPVHVLLAEQSAALADGRRWLHQVVYWLRHDAPTDLNVSWQGNAEVVGVSVDGVEVAPLRPGPGRLWLPLSGRPGVRRVRLRWLYSDSRQPDEELARPSLVRPRLEGALPGPTVWTVYVPAGWRALPSPQARSLGAGPARAAALALERAQALLEVSRAVSAAPRREGLAMLRAAQERFYLACGRVELALEVGAARAERSVAALRLLREENRELARRRNFEALRKQAERRASTGAEPAPRAGSEGLGGLGRGASGTALPERGTPLSWRADPGESAPVVRLVPADAGSVRRALAASAQWLALLALAWVVSLSQRGRVVARRLWPEQLVLLGALGWSLAGPTAVVLVLLLAGVLGRLILLGQGVRTLLLRRRPGPAPARLGSSARG